MLQVVYKIPSILFILITFSSHCQSHYGLKGNIGISRIKTQYDSGLIQNFSEKYYIRPSGHVGVYYHYYWGSKSILGAELLLTQIEGKGKEKFTQFSNDNYSITEYWRHLTYLALPISYGFRSNKTSLNIGFQLNCIIRTDQKIKGKYYESNIEIDSWERNGMKPNLKGWDYGIKASFNRRISEKSFLEINYYHGLKNIYNASMAHDYIWKVQQLTLGYCYELHGNNVKHVFP